MTISLGRRFPGASSDLPGGRAEPGRLVPSGPRPSDGPTTAGAAPLFGLAPGGVYRARAVTRPAGELLPHRFTLTPAETVAVCFLWHCPYPAEAERWALPTTAPSGVQTFLPGTAPPTRCQAEGRPGDHLARPTLGDDLTAPRPRWVAEARSDAAATSRRGVALESGDRPGTRITNRRIANCKGETHRGLQSAIPRSSMALCDDFQIRELHPSRSPIADGRIAHCQRG